MEWIVDVPAWCIAVVGYVIAPVALALTAAVCLWEPRQRPARTTTLSHVTIVRRERPFDWQRDA